MNVKQKTLDILYFYFIKYWCISEKKDKTSKFLTALSGLIFTTVSATTLQTKPLIVYFSLTGNTQGIAESLHKKVGADIFRFVAAEPYPDDYKTQTEIAKK